jgi:hypothetical protein
LSFAVSKLPILIDWKGEPSHSGFQALCEGVTNTIGGAPAHQPIPDQRQKLRWNPPWALAAIATIAVAVGLGVYSIGPWRTTAPTPIPQGDRSEASTRSESKKQLSAVTGLADLVIGIMSAM